MDPGKEGIEIEPTEQRENQAESNRQAGGNQTGETYWSGQMTLAEYSEQEDEEQGHQDRGDNKDILDGYKNCAHIIKMRDDRGRIASPFVTADWEFGSCISCHIGAPEKGVVYQLRCR